MGGSQMKCRFVRLMLAAMLGSTLFVSSDLVLGQGKTTQVQPVPDVTTNFQLVLQGPFVVCEEKDADDLLILATDPNQIQNPHDEPGVSTALGEFKFQGG